MRVHVSNARPRALRLSLRHPYAAHHVADGMYGLRLVEPEGGLPRIARELYVIQGERYTQRPFGQHGPQEFIPKKLLAERPEDVV